MKVFKVIGLLVLFFLSKNEKRNHYRDLPSSLIFQAVAVESLGGIAKSSFVFFRVLGKRITEMNGNKRATICLRQRLGFFIQHGNVACFLEAIKSSKQKNIFSILSIFVVVC